MPEIAREFASKGAGVLTVLHDLNLAATYADRIGVLRDGNIFSIGRSAEVIADGVLRDAFDVDLEVSGTPSAETPFSFCRK